MLAINLGAAMVTVLAFGAWKRLNPDQVDQAHFQAHGRIDRRRRFFEQNIGDVGFIVAANKQVGKKDGGIARSLRCHVYDRAGSFPHCAGGKAERCVLFGDSFTFGEGVNDTETTAAQLSSEQGQGDLNLGIGGWGPHQFQPACSPGDSGAPSPVARPMQCICSFKRT